MFEMIVSAYRWIFLQMSSIFGLGWSIVLLSCICSALMAPLMMAVAGIVRREADYQSVILPQIAAIKAKYASDMERHAHIQALYERYGYSPLSPVKKVLPLFVQIPFLLLTYCMLKGTTELGGVSFLFLHDLGAADGLLGRGINLLPLVMTGVNIVTVFATLGFTVRDRVQAIAIALLFLVMLYTAPSALLLYWTLNNAITMVRTLVAKKGEGGRLLLSRILGLRQLPRALWSALTPERLGWLSLAFMLASVYMWLMVHMEVWFFNCYVSRFLMIPVLLFALSLLALRLAKSGSDCVVCGWLFFGVLFGASLVFVGLVLLGFTSPALMQWTTGHLDFSKAYLMVLAVACLGLVLSSFLACGRKLGLVAAIRAEGHWLFLPIVLALHYSFSSDLVKLPASSVFGLIAELLLPAFLFACVLTLMFASRLNAARVFRMGVAFAVGAYLVPMISLESGKVLAYDNNLVARFVFMMVVSMLMLRFNRRKPVLLFLGILLAATSINAVVTRCRVDGENAARSKSTESEASKSFKAAKAVRHPNVYLLVYDAYAHDKILAEEGINTSRIKTILLPRGFTRYDAYSVGSDTVQSMGNSFAIGGVMQGSVRSMMAGNNPFCDFLKRSGYRTSFLLCAYDMPGRGECMPGDFYFPAPQAVTRLENVLYTCILRGYLSQSANTFNSYSREQWIGEKRKLIAEAAPSNLFVYAHAEMPAHLAASAMYRKSHEAERLGYVRRLAEADNELEADIAQILKKDDDSIIIVASDHGALFRLCERGDYGQLDLLDRCGIQLYVRWPKGYRPTLKLTCLTNVFLETMICLTGDTSLARFESEGASLPIQAPLKAPAGTIRRGIIQNGRDKGKGLFE